MLDASVLHTGFHVQQHLTKLIQEMVDNHYAYQSMKWRSIVLQGYIDCIIMVQYHL